MNRSLFLFIIPIFLVFFSQNAFANEPPQIFIYSPENITYSNENIFFNFTVIDDYSTNISLILYVNGNIVDNYTAENNTNYNGFNEFSISNWTYNFTVWANDTDGNINQTDVIFTIYILPTTLEIFIYSPQNETYSSCPIIFNITMINGNYSIFSYKFFMNGEMVEENNNYANNTNIYIETCDIPNGFYNFTLLAYDNISSNSDSVFFTVNIPPLSYYNGSADISKYLTKYCIDNNTIKANGTYQNQLIEVEYNCPNGCDQGLNICYPSPFMTFLIIIGAFIGLIIIIIIFKKLVGR